MLREDAERLLLLIEAHKAAVAVPARPVVIEDKLIVSEPLPRESDHCATVGEGLLGLFCGREPTRADHWLLLEQSGVSERLDDVPVIVVVFSSLPNSGLRSRRIGEASSADLHEIEGEGADYFYRLFCIHGMTSQEVVTLQLDSHWNFYRTFDRLEDLCEDQEVRSPVLVGSLVVVVRDTL